MTFLLLLFLFLLGTFLLLGQRDFGGGIDTLGILAVRAFAKILAGLAITKAGTVEEDTG